MEKLTSILEFLKNLASRDPRDYLIACLSGAVIFLWNGAYEKDLICDQRVALVEKSAQERYDSSIREMASNYSKAMIRCEEEKRMVLLDGYRKVDSLQVRYKALELKINHLITLNNEKM